MSRLFIVGPKGNQLPCGVVDPHLAKQNSWQEFAERLQRFVARVDVVSILARSMLAVEFFPYRSYSNEYHHERLSLTSSQGYSRVLVYNAMENQAVIVIRYGKAKWFDAVRGLETYQHVLLLKGSP